MLHCNIENIKNQFQYKKSKLIINSKKKSEKISILKEISFFSNNETSIQEKIKSIPYYDNSFYCFQESHLVHFNEIKEQTIEQCHYSVKYIVFNYNIVNKIYFTDYFNNNYLKQLNLTSQKSFFLKEYILTLVQSYQYLLNTLIKINKIKICYFNCKSENIFFNPYNNPIIENFETSIDYSSEIQVEYIVSIINKLVGDLSYLPLEIQIIWYLNKNNYNTLSSTILDEIYYTVVVKLNNITFNYQEYIDLYKPLINWSKDKIILFLLKFMDTWDNYSLSILFIEHLQKIQKLIRYDTKYHFIPKWLHLLKANSSILPKNRYNLEYTKDLLEEILFTF
jgi:hypothetical protein